MMIAGRKESGFSNVINTFMGINIALQQLSCQLEGEYDIMENNRYRERSEQ